MPANAGIHLRQRCKAKKTWIPACAGMTDKSQLLVDDLEPLGLNRMVTAILVDLALAISLAETSAAYIPAGLRRSLRRSCRS